MTLDAGLERYIRHLFAPEDAVLEQIRARHEQEQLPGIFISPEEAQIIVVLLRAIEARHVLEIGTLGGYSGVWIARALPVDGRLVTIEHDPRRASFARKSFAAAGVVDRVELREGEALEVLATLEPSFDAIFVDADKAPLAAYYRESMRLLRVGGLLLCDNAFIDGRIVNPEDTAADVEGVRAFNRLAATDPRLVSALVPVRDGLAVSVKVGGA